MNPSWTTKEPPDSIPFTVFQSLFLVSVFILFFACPLPAQTPIDSILTSISHLPDSSKIKHLNSICWGNRSIKPQLAFDCGQAALELAEKTRNKSLKSRTLNLLGIVCRSLGYYDKSLAYLHNALVTAEESNNITEIGFAENNIGGAYRQKGYYTAAMRHILNGLKAFEKINYQYGVAYSVISIGFIYVDQRDYRKALVYLDSAYRIRHAIGDTAGAGNALNEIGRVYALNNDPKTAVQKLKEAEVLLRKINDQGGLLANSLALGDAYFKQQKYSEALPLLIKAYQLAHDMKIIRNIAKAALDLGIDYTYLDRYDEANEKLKEALKLAEYMQEYTILLDTYSAHSIFYEHFGNAKEALRYSRMYNALKDSVLSKENISGVKEMEAMYENEKAKSENLLLLKDVELSHTQRNYWILITIFILGIAISVLWKYLYQKKAEEKIRLINSQLQALNSTREKFFSIIAHDLRSPFHMMLSISELIANDIDELEPEQLKKFSRELHLGIKKQYELLSDLLEWSKLQRGDFPLEKRELLLSEELISVAEELIVPIQMKEISFRNQIPEDFKVSADSNMLRLVLRNLVSNSIKFSNKNGFIEVSGETDGDKIRIIVKDNGIGIPETNIDKLFRADMRLTTLGTANEKGTGFGLLLCKEIIEKHGGTIDVSSTAGKGTSFSFTVPMA